MKNLTFTFLMLLVALTVTAQTRKDNISISEDASRMGNGNFIHLKNINGDLTVTGYDGDEVKIEAVRELSKRKRRGTVSDSEAVDYQLAVEWHDGNLFVYVDAPGVKTRYRDGRMHYDMHWDGDDDLEFSFDIEVKVPNDILLKASTINGGKLVISNLENGVDAGQVNGDILLEEISGPTSANSVNGDIKVLFALSPKEDCDFRTVNGTIEVLSPADFGAVVTFESVHGELYTDFDEVSYLPNRLNKEADGRGDRYRINKTSPIQIGKGGPEISFEMVNGDAFIKQRKS